MNTTATNLPPGITDQNIEIILIEDELKAFHQGQTINFWDLPKEKLSQLKDDMHAHPEVMDIFRRYQLDQERDQLFVYCKCKFGGYNSTPDLTEAGVATGEHWNCGCNGNCVLQPLLRGKIPVKNGHLTQREIEVSICISQNYTGIQAADKLHISEQTLNNHKTNIFRKTGCNSNVELALFINQLNIV